jgi:lipopolysaccharide transport system permease protein
MRGQSKSQLPASGGGARWIDVARRGREVAVHLALHELASRHRFTALGWAWPLVRQLVQVGVLLFVFTAVFDLGIDDYAVFLFAGLVAWSWFFSAVGDGTGALPAQRHLLLQPRCPAAALPLVPVAAASVDALIALPVLLAVVAVSGTLDPAVIALPALAAIQLVLMIGIVWFTAAANVYLRDVRQLVTVGLLLLFYLTPVFYELGKVPEDLQWILQLNPLTTLIEAYRDVLLEERLPSALPLVAVAAASAAIAVAGLAFFNRLRPGFVDEL